MFRNEPLLAPALLHDALHQSLPEFTTAPIESAELTDIQPTEYRADIVVLLLDDKPVLGIIVEAQLARDDDKIRTQGRVPAIAAWSDWRRRVKTMLFARLAALVTGRPMCRLKNYSFGPSTLLICERESGALFVYLWSPPARLLRDGPPSPLNWAAATTSRPGF